MERAQAPDPRAPQAPPTRVEELPLFADLDFEARASVSKIVPLDLNQPTFERCQSELHDGALEVFRAINYVISACIAQQDLELKGNKLTRDRTSLERQSAKLGLLLSELYEVCHPDGQFQTSFGVVSLAQNKNFCALPHEKGYLLPLLKRLGYTIERDTQLLEQSASEKYDSSTHELNQYFYLRLKAKLGLAADADDACPALKLAALRDQERLLRKIGDLSPHHFVTSLLFGMAEYRKLQDLVNGREVKALLERVAENLIIYMVDPQSSDHLAVHAPKYLERIYCSQRMARVFGDLIGPPHEGLFLPIQRAGRLYAPRLEDLAELVLPGSDPKRDEYLAQIRTAIYPEEKFRARNFVIKRVLELIRSKSSEKSL